MRLTIVALAVSLLATGCGQAVEGTPVASPDDERKAGNKAYETALGVMRQYVKDAKDFRGSLFFYAAVNERKSGSDVEIARKGDPPALVSRRKSKTPPGFDYDVYQPAGDPLEYVRLGPKYVPQIVPTQWASMPAVPYSGFPCAITGIQTLCKIMDALDTTTEAAPPGLGRAAVRLNDGATEVRTEITLKSFVDNSVITIPADVVALIEPDMMGRLIPVKIVVNADGTLRKAEVRGEVAGRGGKVQVEVGYEARGPAEASDFPPLPAPAEVTALPDKTARDEFWTKMANAR
ncbi:hypothetical protein KIPE111705_44260 [Kibdelosporangium persicum]|uniref:Lipoprotein n=1 Tax=Kibdelosporangium persicum TaxID=2698649 RepID=A0ABX2EZP4_9PSEU|nr:hypothetical protein [Kibdelosporangium persicum]NRN64523.1 hypothetical protein [Kibdelosporangium persicum]